MLRNLHKLQQQVGGNEAVLNQLLKMADDIKRSQLPTPRRYFSTVTEEANESTEDFSNQESEVRQIAYEEKLRQMEEDILRKRKKLNDLNEHIRRIETKLHKLPTLFILNDPSTRMVPAEGEN